MSPPEIARSINPHRRLRRLWLGRPFGWEFSRQTFKAGLRQAYRQYSAEINVSISAGALVLGGFVFFSHPFVGAIAVLAAAVICVGFTTSMASLELDEINRRIWIKLMSSAGFRCWLRGSRQPEAGKYRRLLQNQYLLRADAAAEAFVEQLPADVLRQLETAYFDWCEANGETPA